MNKSHMTIRHRRQFLIAVGASVVLLCGLAATHTPVANAEWAGHCTNEPETSLLRLDVLVSKCRKKHHGRLGL